MQWYSLTPDGSDPADPAVFRARAMGAAASLHLAERPGPAELLHRADGCTLLATRDATWMMLPYRDDDAAGRFAAAARATATPTDPPTILNTRLRLAHPVVPWNARLSRTARDNDDDTHVTPPADGFIAITVRREGFRESRGIDLWASDEYNSQADTSKLRDAGCAVGRVTVGAPTRVQARSTAVETAVGLGIGLDSYRAHDDTADRWWPPLMLCPTPLAVWLAPLLPDTTTPLLWGAAILLLTAAGILISGWRHPLLAAITLYLAGLTMLTTLPDTTAMIPAAACTILWVGGTVWWTRPRPIIREVTRRPRHWWMPFTRRRRAGTDDNKTRWGGNDDHPAITVTGYPLHRSSLPIPPATLTRLATPRTGVTVGAATRAPDELVDTAGPIIGRDNTGRPVHIPGRILYGGVFIIGEPGSGKSNLMHGLLAQSPHTGPIIDFEAKGGDALPILRRLMGGRLAICRPADPETVMIDLLDADGPDGRGERFARLLASALGGDQIGPRSRMQLADAASLGIRLTETGEGVDLMERMRLEADSWLDAAGRLLGRSGIPEARRWAMAAGRFDPAAVSRLGFDMTADGKRPMTPDTRLADLLGAPMNKVDALLSAAPQVWRTGRRRIPWRHVLDHDVTVVIDLDGLAGAQDTLGAMLLTALRDAIRDTCDGWRERDRTVTVACDELSILAGADPDVPEWFREKGRSYGVRPLFATQNPDQLAPSLMRSTLGYMTLVCFALRNPTVADPVARALDQGRGAYTPRRLASIATHCAAVRTVGVSGMLDAPVIHVTDFDHTSPDAWDRP